MSEKPQSKPKVIRLRGVVASGKGIAVGVTEFPWVKEQFIRKLGIDTYPGTFNIMVCPEDLEKLKAVRQAPGIEIVPPNENHCAGITLHAVVGGKVKGAVVIPHVTDYHPAQLEVISQENVRKAWEA